MQIEKAQKDVKAIKPTVLPSSNGEGSSQHKLFNFIYSPSEGTIDETNFLDNSFTDMIHDNSKYHSTLEWLQTWRRVVFRN